MNSPEWQTFTRDLAATFPRLRSDDAVILEHQGCPTVQFIFGLLPDLSHAHLTAEVFADDVLPDTRRYGPAGAARLSDLGWTPASQTGDNWTTRLAWPFSGQACLALARQIVTTLRDIFGVPAPTDLSYQAFNVITHQDLVLPVLTPLSRIPR